VQTAGLCHDRGTGRDHRLASSFTSTRPDDSGNNAPLRSVSAGREQADKPLERHRHAGPWACAPRPNATATSAPTERLARSPEERSRTCPTDYLTVEHSAPKVVMNVAPFAPYSARDRPVVRIRCVAIMVWFPEDHGRTTKLRRVRAHSVVAFGGNSSKKTQGFA